MENITETTLTETAKEIDRILDSGIEILPNSPIHEKLKKALNLFSVSDMFSFGDIVKAKCTATGRYIGKGKCVYISAMCNDRGIDDVKEKCENIRNLPVVDDKELENYR